MKKLCKWANPNFRISRQEDAKCGCFFGWWDIDELYCHHPFADKMKNSEGDIRVDAVLCDVMGNEVSPDKLCAYYVPVKEGDL
jgi:hypothetical protein